MHLPAATEERIDDGASVIDLDQQPADIVFLSTADTELASIAAAVARRRSGPAVRLANPGQLAHPMSVDLYVEKTLSRARLIVLRMHGGPSYWPHGLEQVRALARAGGIKLAVLPGEDWWNADLEAYSTVSPESARLAWRYCVEGGPGNSDRLLQLLASWLGEADAPAPPEPLPRAGFYQPGRGVTSLDGLLASRKRRPVAVIAFYRALLLGGSMDPVDALCRALERRGLFAVPVFVPSLRDADAEQVLGEAFAAMPAAVVLNGTAFAAGAKDGAAQGTVLDRPGRPVMQLVFSGGSEEGWRDSLRGLGPRDLAMNVVMPELDGRILTRPVSFKSKAELDDRTGHRIATYRAVPDRIDFVARQAAAWVRLGAKPASERKVAVILSNYPNRDGRLGNGVGLDTPESAVRLGAAMAAAGYSLAGFPSSSARLMDLLLSGPTNAGIAMPGGVWLKDEAFDRFLAAIPEGSRGGLRERWGAPSDDPFHDHGGFRLPVHRFGNVVVAIQPSRGYDDDPKATYHDPDLVPPYRYLAFYAWLRMEFGADAIVHLGKHGNLEWLPGKAVGLSAACWPEIALGETPVVYPFIVNDPGEGTQAKRRSSAVIIDHLTPPLARAELHGALARLETLIDEYYLAAGVDQRRRAALEQEIAALAAREHLDRELGFAPDGSSDALRALDAHLCDLKEMQIRDGLHVLGASPTGSLRTSLLVAIARAARPGTRARDASLHRAIANDLELGFDPLACDLAEEWRGRKPDVLLHAVEASWRTAGDTVERIEALAERFVRDGLDATVAWPTTAAVLDWIAGELAPALDRSGAAETAAVLAALDGRFVPPGPSGAPTRGRPEVMPTGRNFFSVDSRAVPTEAAWRLGRSAAEALALRHLQDEGEWPRSIALSAWATSNMRTGGDDVAVALALIGAEPVWEAGTGRVTGFRVMTLAELKRPRVDVTLRVSGMFRDAFPMQLDLLDSAMRAVAALDEPADANPLAAATREAAARLSAAGLDTRLAAARIFGAKPGAYGAGLQALIDEGVWEKRSDFADAFLAWSAFAYGGGLEGDGAQDVLVERLKAADAVLHNQDNREHDILDSDDYYQFQGGLAATVETLKGKAVPLYHGDTSRPERPVMRSLREEVARVVRGRAANPKWIAGVMRHGYKGAFEMAATVDYLFAFAATTDAVANHQFDMLYDAYLGDAGVRGFITGANAPALREMAERFREAIDRGLWRPQRNSVYEALSALIAGDVKEAAE
jgi:cobaltochelatase CobN